MLPLLVFVRLTTVAAVSFNVTEIPDPLKTTSLSVAVILTSALSLKLPSPVEDVNSVTVGLTVSE